MIGSKATGKPQPLCRERRTAPQRLEPWLPLSMDAARKQASSQFPGAVCPEVTTSISSTTAHCQDEEPALLASAPIRRTQAALST